MNESSTIKIDTSIAPGSENPSVDPFVPTLDVFVRGAGTNLFRVLSRWQNDNKCQLELPERGSYTILRTRMTEHLLVYTIFAACARPESDDDKHIRIRFYISSDNFSITQHVPDHQNDPYILIYSILGVNVYITVSKGRQNDVLVFDRQTDSSPDTELGSGYKTPPQKTRKQARTLFSPMEDLPPTLDVQIPGFSSLKQTPTLNQLVNQLVENPNAHSVFDTVSAVYKYAMYNTDQVIKMRADFVDNGALNTYEFELENVGYTEHSTVHCGRQCQLSRKVSFNIEGRISNTQAIDMVVSFSITYKPAYKVDYEGYRADIRDIDMGGVAYMNKYSDMDLPNYTKRALFLRLVGVRTVRTT